MLGTIVGNGGKQGSKDVVVERSAFLEYSIFTVMHVVVLQKPLFKLICMLTTSFTSIVVTVAAIVTVCHSM